MVSSVCDGADAPAHGGGSGADRRCRRSGRLQYAAAYIEVDYISRKHILKKRLSNLTGLTSG
jgi:hypothetical protein